MIPLSLSNNPADKNPLAQLNFELVLKRAPHVKFFINQINIPGISLPAVEVPNPLVTIPYPGDHINFEPLNVTFSVDEDFQSYIEIQKWIYGLGSPESYNAYQLLESNPSWTGEGVVSDISLIIQKNTKTPNYEIIFKDAFPIQLSGLDFKTTDIKPVFIEAKVLFKYTSFYLSNVF